jgi:Carboxypeptidase regulatory-like domain
MRKLTSFYLGLLLGLAFPVAGQQPADSAPVASPSQSPAAPPQASRASSSSTGKKKPLPVYLLIGTVFNEKALSFPDAKVRIRQTSEKKFRWETYTNSRGEFAVRVPEGNEYEVQVQARNFKGQSLTVKADTGSVQQRLSFRLEPMTPGKAGDKK